MVDGPAGRAGAGLTGAAGVDVTAGGGAGAGATLAGAEDVAAGAEDVAAGADVVLVGAAGVSGAGGGIWNPARGPMPSRINKMATAPPMTISTLPVAVLNHRVGADPVSVSATGSLSACAIS